MPGAVGVYYRQFALTMAISIVLSGVVALTLTPVLSAMILKAHFKHPPRGRVIGTTAVGGMLIGTLIGVLVTPGLDYLFAKLAGQKKLIRDEHERPLSEIVEHPIAEHSAAEHLPD